MTELLPDLANVLAYRYVTYTCTVTAVQLIGLLLHMTNKSYFSLVH